MATQPVLATKTLPWPKNEDGYAMDYEYRGASREMADASIVYDLVSDTVRRNFTLSWDDLTDTERGDIQDAWDALKSTYASFTSLTGGTYNVMRDPDSKLTFKAHSIAGGKEVRWSATIVLRQV